MSHAKHLLHFIEKQKIQFIDLRFTDTLGKEQHVTLPVSAVNEELLTQGKLFDGSSIKGWQQIHMSDLLLMPEPETFFVDPFCLDATVIVRCHVLEPSTQADYGRDPRAVAKRAEQYLKETGIADTCYVGPEPEFFLFDDVRWKNGMSGSFYKIDSEEAAWNSSKQIPGGNMGHRPTVKGGYFPVPPVDSSQDIRSAICLKLQQLGMVVEVHHHEVATSNQNEITTQFSRLLTKADELQLFKYVVHNVAHAHGKTATFMPKPLVGDNGNGMHCHQSLAKNGHNIFAGDIYAGLSQQALFYIGGIIKHAKALNAFTNPATNSYRRLVPGFEAPVLLAYSSRNRSAAVRIPVTQSDKATRIEVRFPDPMANPYLAFSAMLMAGLDGIEQQIDPGEPSDKDLYRLPEAELQGIPKVSSCLERALYHLENDHDFLLRGGVFTNDFIDSYIELKREEVLRLYSATHPLEFEMYYSG